MSDKLQFSHKRVWNAAIFIEEETTYNGLPMTWGRQHNFTQLAFVEAEWRERRETWQRLWNEKIENMEKVTEVSNNKLGPEKKKPQLKWRLKVRAWMGMKKIWCFFYWLYWWKKPSFMTRKCLLKSFVQCFDVVILCGMLANCPKY